MLSKLTVKNYVLIDELEVEFEKGFNIITGETGAGKSILLGALSLLSGARADSSVLRDGASKCVVEGAFSLENNKLAALFESNGLDFENPSIFRREITSAGKSRAFVNDTPVALKTMSELASKLVDIHSQHQNLELGNHRFQLGVVDIIARSQPQLSQYRECLSIYREAARNLSDIKGKAEKERANLDYYEFQFNQLDKARLLENEQEELEEEQEKLSHSEEIKNALLAARALLDGEERAVLARLKEALSGLSRIKGYFKDIAGLHSRLESSFLELKDISEEIESLSEAVEFDPEKLAGVTARLDLIFTLEQKHHVSSVKELLELKSGFEKHLAEITDFDSEIARLTKELGNAGQNLREAAGTLTRKRQEVFGLIGEKVTGILAQLGLPHAKFRVALAQKNEFSDDGTDTISFLFSANKNSEPDEISRIASGGEISRLMLAVKSLIASSGQLPTVIFDEIDSGISGEIALKTGAILKEFSRSAQVINITHLPQIAGKGEHHYLVYKSESEKGATTLVRKLDHAGRVEEMAKMVGGDNPSQTAIKTAKELLG